MVRVSKASRQQRMIHQQYKENQKLFNRHYLYLIVLALIGLSIAFYFYLLAIEERATAANKTSETDSKDAVRKNHHNKKERATVDRLLDPDSSPDEAAAIFEQGRIDNDEEEELDEEVDEDLMMPFAASRVVSAGLPFLVYGTAWKKEETARLVTEAIHAGFRFVDTACQPKHYNERGVGKGWTMAAEELGLQRKDLFLQTKFTSISGQDPHKIPYDPHGSLEDQVAESLEMSLRNLQTSYLDSWVMHSPMPTIEETMTVYRVMEQAVDDGKVLRLGISNCYEYDTFTTIYNMARIKPKVLQNRFYEESNWDQELRKFCDEHDIWYQSFWTLTANRHALATQEAREWARSKNLTPQTLLYAYLMSLGYGTPLDGTTSRDHMDEDIEMMIRLQNGESIFENADEIRRFERLLGF